MSTIKANTLLHSDGSTTNPPAIPALDKRMAKAWVSLSSTTINDSYNISSITDAGAIGYTITFTTPMPDAHYVAVAQVSSYSGSAQNYSAGIAWMTSSNFNFHRESSSSVDTALDDASVVVFSS